MASRAAGIPIGTAGITLSFGATLNIKLHTILRAVLCGSLSLYKIDYSKRQLDHFINNPNRFILQGRYQYRFSHLLNMPIHFRLIIINFCYIQHFRKQLEKVIHECEISRYNILKQLIGV